MKAIQTIKNYAQDSINYGNKSGNRIAATRGNDVMYAILEIEKDYNNLAHAAKLLEVEHAATEICREDLNKATLHTLKRENFETNELFIKAIKSYFFEVYV